jgi:hypothetical protein
LALGQASSMVIRLLKQSGQNGLKLDYTAQCSRQMYRQVCISYRANPNGLHWLVDSTDMKMWGEGKWKLKKHGAEYRRQWRKVRLGTDAEILEIRAVEVTSNRVGDVQVLPDSLAQIPDNDMIVSVRDDDAYDNKNSHKTPFIVERGADAIIPVRKNGKPRKENTEEPKSIMKYYEPPSG